MIRDYDSFQLIYSEEFSNYNTVIFNILDFIFFVYFFLVYYKVLQSSKSKKIVKYGVLLFCIVSIINPFFQNLFLSPQTYLITVGSIVLIVAILLYFKDLKLKGEKTIQGGNPLFWISIGLLIFYSLYPILMSNLWSSPYYENYHVREVHQFLIAIMYLFFIVGFAKMKRRLVI